MRKLSAARRNERPVAPAARSDANGGEAELLNHWRRFESLRRPNVNDFILDAHQRLKAGQRPKFAAELASVRYIKRASAQMDTLLHCLAIAEVLRARPTGERVEALSLGAGTGDGTFDVKTNRRVVEVMLSAFSTTGRDSVRRDRTNLLTESTSAVYDAYDSCRPPPFFSVHEAGRLVRVE